MDHNCRLGIEVLINGQDRLNKLMSDENYKHLSYEHVSKLN